MAVTREIAQRQLMGDVPPQPAKHSKDWVRANPEQSAADIFRMNMAIKESLRLLRTGSDADRAEALTWLNNASKI